MLFSISLKVDAKQRLHFREKISHHFNDFFVNLNGDVDGTMKVMLRKALISCGKTDQRNK